MLVQADIAASSLVRIESLAPGDMLSIAAGVHVQSTGGPHTYGNTVTVGSGGTLAGEGSLGGTVVVESGGAVTPGSSLGTIRTGDLDLQSGANFNVEIEGTGAG